MKIKHLSFFILISVFCFLFSCNEKKNTENKPDATQVNSATENSNSYSLRVYKSNSLNNQNEFQFEILVNGEPFIIQKNIPAVNGNHPFHSENEARKVGELMQFKLENNISPPAITIHELDSLKINYK